MGDDFEDEEGGKIIPIRKKGPERFPLHTGAKTPNDCRHLLQAIDDRARRVYCKTCGVDLDPIMVLWEIARTADWVVHMRSERAKLLKEMAELKDELTKLRAAKRRASVKIPP